MKDNTLLFICLTFLSSCSKTNSIGFLKPEVEIEIVNKSSLNLENTEVHFENNICDWGYLVKNGRKGYGFYPHPISAHAELYWDEDGKHRGEKFDLSQIHALEKSGTLTFTIYNDRAEATFRPKRLDQK